LFLTKKFADVVRGEKEKNKGAFQVTIDLTSPFVCQRSSLELNGEEPNCLNDLLEAADLFEFCSPDGTPLKLTTQQTGVRDKLLEHVCKVLYNKRSFNNGAGRLVLGRKGVAKTTTLMMVQAILSSLLPSKHLVFFCSLGRYPDVMALFQEVSRIRLGQTGPLQSGRRLKT
jgi:hypothetical protein